MAFARPIAFRPSVSTEFQMQYQRLNGQRKSCKVGQLTAPRMVTAMRPGCGDFFSVVSSTRTTHLYLFRCAMAMIEALRQAATVERSPAIFEDWLSRPFVVDNRGQQRRDWIWIGRIPAARMVTVDEFPGGSMQLVQVFRRP